MVSINAREADLHVLLNSNWNRGIVSDDSGLIKNEKFSGFYSSNICWEFAGIDSKKGTTKNIEKNKKIIKNCMENARIVGKRQGKFKTVLSSKITQQDS